MRKRSKASEPLPPHDIQAEIGTLGSVVLLASSLAGVKAALPSGPAAFYDPFHAAVYRTMLALEADSQPIDITLLQSRLKENGEWDAGQLSKIINSVPNAAHANYYAEIVQEKFRRRQLLTLGIELQQQSQNGQKLEDIEAHAAAVVNGRYVAPASPPPSLGNLKSIHPRLRDPVIHGLLRRGETANIIAASKAGKSWGTYEIAFCVATGKRIWETFLTVPGPVLIVDNELHQETSAYRMALVCEALELDPAEVDEKIFIENLRGRQFDVSNIVSYLGQFQPRHFQLVIIDAFYRILPEGTDENSNAAITAIYNKLDAAAAQLDCAIALVHHSSKGNQSAKAVTDVGSGAGSQSRAADTHLILRPHQEDGVVVLEAAVRSWPPVEPLCLKWEFPVWRRNDSFDAGELRPERPKVSQSKSAEKILRVLVELGEATRTQLAARANCSRETVGRALTLLLDAGQVEEFQIQTRAGKREGYRATPDTPDTPDSTPDTPDSTPDTPDSPGSSPRTPSLKGRVSGVRGGTAESEVSGVEST